MSTIVMTFLIEVKVAFDHAKPLCTESVNSLVLLPVIYVFTNVCYPLQSKP